MQFDKPQTMTPEAHALVDLVAGGAPVCNFDMDDLALGGAMCPAGKTSYLCWTVGHGSPGIICLMACS